MDVQLQKYLYHCFAKRFDFRSIFKSFFDSAILIFFICTLIRTVCTFISMRTVFGDSHVHTVVRMVKFYWILARFKMQVVFFLTKYCQLLFLSLVGVAINCYIRVMQADNGILSIITASAYCYCSSERVLKLFLRSEKHRKETCQMITVLSWKERFVMKIPT